MNHFDTFTWERALFELTSVQNLFGIFEEMNCLINKSVRKEHSESTLMVKKRISFRLEWSLLYKEEQQVVNLDLIF